VRSGDRQGGAEEWRRGERSVWGGCRGVMARGWMARVWAGR
jgi:hypothetical protein